MSTFEEGRRLSLVYRLLQRFLHSRDDGYVPPRKTGLQLSPDIFDIDHGLPYPRWSAIGVFIRSLPADFTPHEYYCDAVEIWLRRLIDSLGPSYHIRESRHFMVLVPENSVTILKAAERIREEIIRLLNQAAWTNGAGKHVVLIFKTMKEYQAYQSHFDRGEGRIAASGGVCIFDGYVHIAIPTLREYERGLAHELTHNLLAHRKCPLWLEEGIATIVGNHFSGSRNYHERIKARRMECHRRYWHRHGLDHFWKGRSFRFPGGQRLSYQLSVILTKVIIDHAGSKFGEFVLKADRADMGAAAATNILGHPLEYFAEQVLGPGDWAPRISEVKKSID
jgi:hypothetical protein